MGNSEILGLQFEPAKALWPDSNSGKSWKICSSGDSEPTSTRQKEASVDIGACVSTAIKCQQQMSACVTMN